MYTHMHAYIYACTHTYMHTCIRIQACTLTLFNLCKSRITFSLRKNKVTWSAVFYLSTVYIRTHTCTHSVQTADVIVYILTAPLCCEKKTHLITNTTHRVTKQRRKQLHSTATISAVKRCFCFAVTFLSLLPLSFFLLACFVCLFSFCFVLCVCVCVCVHPCACACACVFERQFIWRWKY